VSCAAIRSGAGVHASLSNASTAHGCGEANPTTSHRLGLLEPRITQTIRVPVIGVTLKAVLKVYPWICR
jgi:hypothetical protein